MLLNYIDDFGGVAITNPEALQQFGMLHATLEKLGLEEVKHKSSPLLSDGVARTAS